LESLFERVAVVRTGLVLDAREGALGKMLPAFQLGLGGPIGGGAQWMSWISVEDWIRGIDFLSDSSNSAGNYNFCSESPAKNIQFTKVLGRVLKRPAFLPVPSWALKLVLGEMAEETILSSTRVKPERLVESGFEFSYPDLEKALGFSLGKRRD